MPLLLCKVSCVYISRFDRLEVKMQAAGHFHAMVPPTAQSARERVSLNILCKIMLLVASICDTT